MATVYLAEDVRHHRRVALTVRHLEQAISWRSHALGDDDA
jgi:hypothetical protein